jgi:hypothetical protein
MKLRIAPVALLVALWAASGTTLQGKQALSRAVLILLVPPVGLMTFGMAVAFRYGKKRDQEDSSGEV